MLSGVPDQKRFWLMMGASALLVFTAAAALARYVSFPERGTPQSPLPTISVVLNGHRVTAEVANNEDTQARGLMFRPALAPDAGMLFQYPYAAPRSVWMKGMQFSVDVVFIRGLTVVDYEDSVPPPSATRGEAATVTTLEEADAVLLMAPGQAEAWDVGIGTPVQFTP